MKRFSLLPSLSLYSSAHKLAIALVGVSVIQGILNNTLLLLVPSRTLFGLEIWRPFTALLVAVSPMEIIFGALIVYSIGGALEQSWGRKRFLKVILGIPLLAELFTLLFFAIIPGLYDVPYHGASSLITTIWIAFGLRAAYSGQLLNFWGAPIQGKTFALIGLGFVVLTGVFSSFLLVLPDLFAALFTYSYMYRRRWFDLTEVKGKIELSYYNWKLKRLKNRSGLRVVKGSRDDEDLKPKIH
jgi:membrane associated rhomboid family serine protease